MAGKRDGEQTVDTIEAAAEQVTEAGEKKARTRTVKKAEPEKAAEAGEKKTRTRTAKPAEPAAEKKTRTRVGKTAEPAAEKKTRTRTVKSAEQEKKAASVEETAVLETKAAEPEVSVVIQYASREITAKDVAAAAVEAYKAAHEGAEIHTVTAYVKPEENAVYYVVNGDDSEGSNKLDLFR